MMMKMAPRAIPTRRPITFSTWRSYIGEGRRREIDTFEIRKRPRSKRPHYIPDGIDGIHDARRGRSLRRIETKVLAVLAITVDGAHEGAVVAVDTGVEHGDADTPVELSLHQHDDPHLENGRE